MKKLMSCLIMLGIVAPVCGMQREQTFDLVTIKPYSTTPITMVPSYLRENPTQHTRFNWESRLSQIISAADTVTADGVRRLAKSDEQFTKERP